MGANSKLAATFHGSGPCKKSCCWTPYGTCARQWSCDHHRDSARAQAAADEWKDAVARSEARAKRLSDAESKRMNEWGHWR